MPLGSPFFSARACTPILVLLLDLYLLLLELLLLYCSDTVSSSSSRASSRACKLHFLPTPSLFTLLFTLLRSFVSTEHIASLTITYFSHLYFPFLSFLPLLLTSIPASSMTDTLAGSPESMSEQRCGKEMVRYGKENMGYIVHCVHLVAGTCNSFRWKTFNPA